MKRSLAFFTCAAAALALSSSSAVAQPIPPPGLKVVTHGPAFVGTGTVASPLNLTAQACGGGLVVSGWDSDGAPTCVTAGGVTGSGTTGALAKWVSGTAVGSSPLLDTGTRLETSVPLVVFGNPAAFPYALVGDNGFAGSATNGYAAVLGSNYGTFDTTAGALTNYGLKGSSTATRSAGSNTLTNVGVYGEASGAQLNYSFFGASGSLYNAGQSILAGGASLTGTLSLQGAGGSDGQVLKRSGGLPTWGADNDTLGPDGDKGDVIVGGTGTTLSIDNGSVISAKLNITPTTCSGQFVSAISATGVGTCTTPTDNDHALVTSNAIPKGNGTTQVASLLTDNGTTVANAGNTNLTAGVASVGSLGGKVQVVATCGNDIALNSDTTVLVCQSGGVNGIQGGYDGRVLLLVSEGAIAIAHEAVASTAANRLQVYSGLSGIMLTSEVKWLYYSGTASRWRATDGIRYPQLYTDGTLTVAGNTTLGDAASDTVTSKAVSFFDPATTPTASQVNVRANTTTAGAQSLTTLGQDNSLHMFDAEYIGSAWVARDTSWAGIAKHGDLLKFLCGSGTTAGSTITSAVTSALAAPCAALDLTTGTFGAATINGSSITASTNLNATLALTVGGTATHNGDTIAGDNDSDYLNARATLAFSGTDVSAGAGTTNATGEAQSFRVVCATSITACVVNFNRTLNSAPYCVATKGSSAADDMYISTTSTTSMTISFPSTTAKANTYNVFCPDRR